MTSKRSIIPLIVVDSGTQSTTKIAWFRQSQIDQRRYLGIAIQQRLEREFEEQGNLCFQCMNILFQSSTMGGEYTKGAKLNF